MTTKKFLRAVQLYIADNFPGQTPEAVTVRMQSGHVVRLPVTGIITEVQIGGESERMREGESQVFGFVPDADKPGWTSQKIAKESGYRNNSYFRTILRSLRNKGKIVLTPEGYKKAK